MRFSAVARSSAAVVRALQEQADQDGAPSAGADHEQVVDRHAEIGPGDLAVDEIDVVERLRIGAPDEAKGVLEHQNERERQQQLETLVAIVDRAEHPLDGWSDGGHQQAGGKQHRQQHPRRQPSVHRKRDQRDAEVGAERVERAAGQVDDLLHAEHELQPGRDQKKHSGMENAAEKEIGE